MDHASKAALAPQSFQASVLKIFKESLVAAGAATIGALLLEVPVWAVFIGWISFFTRGANLRQGVVNLACVWAGIAIGMAAGWSLSLLSPLLGGIAVMPVVFAVAMVVLSLRALPVYNNLLGFFLGLVAFFAAHAAPSAAIFLELGLAATLGAAAAWLASRV